MLFGLHQICPLQYHRWPPGNYIFNVLCARRRREIKLKNCCQKNISCALSPFLLAASARAKGSFATVKLVGSWTSGELNQFANDLMPAWSNTPPRWPSNGISWCVFRSRYESMKTDICLPSSAASPQPSIRPRRSIRRLGFHPCISPPADQQPSLELEGWWGGIMILMVFLALLRD